MPADLNASRFIYLKVRVDPSQAQKDFRSMSAGVFHFRDSVNVLFNSFAKVFRELARIRTAFFILVTFLGLRRVYAFFKDISDQSYAAQTALEGIQSKFSLLKLRLADRMAPIFAELGDRLMQFIDDAIEYIANEPQILEWPIKLIDKIAQAVSSLVTDVLPSLLPIARDLLAVLSSIGRVVGYIFVKAIDGFKHIGPFLLEFLSEAAFGWHAFLEYMGASADALDPFAKIHENMKVAATKMKIELERISRDMPDELRDTAGTFKDFATALTNLTNTTVSESPKFVSAVSKMVNTLLYAPMTRFTNFLMKNLEDIVAYMRANPVSDQTKTMTETELSFRNFAEGFSSSVKKISDAAQELGKALYTAFEGGLSDTIVAAWNFKWKSMRDIAVNMLKDIQKAMADFVARSIMKGLLEMILAPAGNALGGLLFPSTPTTPAGVLQDLKTNPPQATTVNLSVNTPDTRAMSAYLMNHKDDIVKIVTEGVAGGNASLRRSVQGA